ncbi:MAG TPA: NifU family protein [Acidimicrobiales bacterium]|nr:NifU family protein [Acidimicrobiales bacterium]
MEQTFSVSEKARKRVVALRADEPDEGLALWVEVVGANATEFVYDLYFQGVEHADPHDLVLELEDLTVVVPDGSRDLLAGAKLDVNRDLLNPGLLLDNPNRPPTGAVSPEMASDLGELTGTVEERVRTVLDRQINPAVASHGGRAELVSVSDTGVVSLRLSGGCQGCGQAAATLRNGIEVALRQHIPEITEIVDVTDHAAGENPYISA